MKVNSPAGEGSPIVTEYNYATGEYMQPNYYNGLEEEINNRNTRMGRNGYAPVPNYMIGTGNSPMDRGGNNLMPSPQQGFEYLTSGGYPPPSAMPQNANVFPAMYNQQTGQRIDPQSGNGLVPYAPMVDKHSSSRQLGKPMFSGTPAYLQQSQSHYGATQNYRDVNGNGGYRYRQFSDGSIVILKSPSGASNTPVSKNTSAWQAITREIGAYPASGSTLQQGASNLVSAGQEFAQSEKGQSVISSLFDRFVSTQSAKTEEQRLLAQQAQAQQQAIAKGMQPSVWEKAMPYVIGLAVIGTLGTVMYVATKPKSSKKSK
jgi:hypothetical protein